MKIIGTILLLLGLLFTVLAGFQIASKKFVAIDQYQISNPNATSIFWSPITAIALVFTGSVVLFIAKKERHVEDH